MPSSARCNPLLAPVDVDNLALQGVNHPVPKSAAPAGYQFFSASLLGGLTLTIENNDRGTFDSRLEAYPDNYSAQKRACLGAVAAHEMLPGAEGHDPRVA